MITVDARAVERVLSLVENEDHVDPDVLDDSEELREAVDHLSGELHAYAEANPSFDEE
jgi:hypothetical protein